MTPVWGGLARNVLVVIDLLEGDGYLCVPKRNIAGLWVEEAILASHALPVLPTDNRPENGGSEVLHFDDLERCFGRGRRE